MKPASAVSETLEALQALLLRSLSVGEKALRIEGLNLGLLQETLAEAHGTRKLCWTNLSVPPLRDKGISSEAIAARFDAQTDEAKQYAYGVAHNIIKDPNSVKEVDNQSTAPDDSGAASHGQPVDPETDDSQPMLF